MGVTGLGSQEVVRMSLDLYTSNIPLSHKVMLTCMAPEPNVRTWYPSITETLPPTYPNLRQEFGKLESLMWNQRKLSRAVTPVLPDANDRIHSMGYDYCPVHTEIYGTYRNRDRRGGL